MPKVKEEIDRTKRLDNLCTKINLGNNKISMSDKIT